MLATISAVLASGTLTINVAAQSPSIDRYRIARQININPSDVNVVRAQAEENIPPGHEDDFVRIMLNGAVFDTFNAADPVHMATLYTVHAAFRA